MLFSLWRNCDQNKSFWCLGLLFQRSRKAVILDSMAKSLLCCQYNISTSLIVFLTVSGPCCGRWCFGLSYMASCSSFMEGSKMAGGILLNSEFERVVEWTCWSETNDCHSTCSALSIWQSKILRATKVCSTVYLLDKKTMSHFPCAYLFLLLPS